MRPDSRLDTGGPEARRNAVIAIVSRRVERTEDFAAKVKRAPPTWPTNPDPFIEARAREKVLRAWLAELGVLGMIGAAEVYEAGTSL